MRRLILLGILLVALASNAAADPDDPVGAEIAKECSDRFEPLVSMPHPNKTYSNIGNPNLYEYKVCVRGLVESTISPNCQGAVAFYISSNTTSAHFSKQRGYNLEVCTGNIGTTINETCNPGSIPLFSVSDKINGFGRHVAGLSPGNRYDNTVCAVYSQPENITFGIKFNLSSSDEVYFDNQQINGEFEDSTIADFPYLLASSGNTLAGIAMKDYKTVSREIDTYNKFEVTRGIGNGSYYLPFTRGGVDDFERSQSDFFQGQIDSGLDPSFRFEIERTPVVRAIARQKVVIVTNLSVGAGDHNIQIEKTGDNEITIRER